MSEPMSLDPFVLVRALVSRLEKSINKRAGPLLLSEGFAKNANRAMSAALVATKLAQALRQRHFEALNIPSRTDLLALADRLQAIEDRLLGLQQTLEPLAGGSGKPAFAAPSRTRKPPPPVVEAAAAPPKRARKAKGAP